MARILLIDDDPHHLDLTTYALRRQGFAVSTALDGATALCQIESDPPNAAVLDMQMPRMSGFQVLQTIRLGSKLPVIMLSGNGNDDDVVRALQLGADDYVTKPFSPRQLTERIRAVLRRSEAQLPEPATEIEAAGMVLDLDSHELRLGDQSVRMTPIEFRILQPLLLNVGKVIPTARLIELTWGFDGGDSYALKTHICHIRRKLRRSPGESGYVRGIPGTGYILGA